MNEANREKLKTECRQIQEDSTYTAEVHYLIGGKLRKRGRVLKLIPPVITIASAGALLLGAPDWVEWVTLFGAIVTVSEMFLDVDRAARDHVGAAKDFTVLKHEARSLREVFADFMSEAEALQEARRLRDRYNWLVTSTPPTDDRAAWEQARENIRRGVHEADFRRSQTPGKDGSAKL